MKTTLELPEDLLRTAKKAAVDQNITFRGLCIRALCKELKLDPPAPGKIRWVTHPGGLPAGLDLKDRGSLHAWIQKQRSYDRH